MRVAPAIRLSDIEQQQLVTAVRDPNLRIQLRRRYQVLLMASQGMQDIEIAAQLGINRRTAARWRLRYLESGLESVKQVVPSPGRKPRYSEEALKRAKAMIEAKPAFRSPPFIAQIAKATGISHSTAWRLWQRKVRAQGTVSTQRAAS